MNRRWREMALAGTGELRSLLGFSPLILGSILIALLATAAGPATTYCLFQSPVSPIATFPVESPAAASPAVPQESPTYTGPVLRAEPAPLNFVPWIIGLLVVIIVVGVVLYWRGARRGGEGSA